MLLLYEYACKENKNCKLFKLILNFLTNIVFSDFKNQKKSHLSKKKNQKNKNKKPHPHEHGDISFSITCLN